MALEEIREKKHSKGMYVIIGFLLVGMAGFGTSQFGTGGGVSEKALLSIGDVEISSREYDDMLRYIQQNNPTLATEQAQALTLGSLRERIALADYLVRYPYAASNAQIDSAIRNDPTFFENGKFSEAVFRQRVTVAPEIYRRSLSNTLSMQDFQMAIMGTGVLSDAELQPYLTTMSRDISVAKIAADSFSATIDEQAIDDYYQQHQSDFMTAEKYQLEYIDFNPALLTQDMAVTEEEIKQHLQSTRQASYYLFKDQDTAQATYEQINGGKTMAELAPTLGKALEDSDDLGKLSATASPDALIPQAAVDAIFALHNVGEVTAPITVDGAVYLFELTDKESTTPSDSALAAAKQAAQQKKAAAKIAKINEKLNQSVFENASPSLAGISEATQLAVQKTDIIAADESILTLPELRAAVENSDKVTGKLQEPVTIGERVIIYRLNEVVQPQQKAFAEVKENIKQMLIANAIDEQVNNAANALIEQTKTDGLKAAAEKSGYPVQSYANFDGSVAQTSVLDPLAALILAQQSPKLGKEKADKISSPSGDAYVFVTDAVRLDSAEASNAQARVQLNQTLLSEMGALELADFLLSVAQRAKIIDRSAERLNQ